MASKVENSVDIARPVAEVFGFVDDFRNTTRYIVGMTQYKPTTARENGKGARFSMVKKTTGLPDIKSVVEIVEWEQDRKIAFESISGFDNSGSYTFTVRGDRTTVKLVNVYDLTTLSSGGGIFGGIKKAALGALSGASEGQARKDLTASLDQLKSLVEASPQPPVAAKTSGKVKASTARPAAKAPGVKEAASAATKTTATTAKTATKSNANGRASAGGKTAKK